MMDSLCKDFDSNVSVSSTPQCSCSNGSLSSSDASGSCTHTTLASPGQEAPSQLPHTAGNNNNNEDSNVTSNGGGVLDQVYGEQRTDCLSWEEYFMAVAFLSAQRSKDPVTQVGACLVNCNRQIVGIGYNGMPQGCPDSVMPWGKTSQDPLLNKYMYVCHAELNAILNKNSVDVSDCVLYVALFPCNECAKIIIQSGIKRIVYYSDKHKDKISTVASKNLFAAAGVHYRPYEGSITRLRCSFDAPSIKLSLSPSSSGTPSTPPRSPSSPRSNYLKWEEYFMAVAFLSALRSKDPQSQVGACIVNKHKRIVAIGYNGMPTHCPDDRMPWNRSPTQTNSLHDPSLYVCHAELNAILNKNSANVRDCVLYVALFPCNECAKIIIQSGIKRIVYYSDKHKDKISTVASKKLLQLAGVAVSPYRCDADDSLRAALDVDFSVIDRP